MNASRKLNVVADESGLAELRQEVRDMRAEFRIWQAVTCGVVAGLALILGAIVMAIYQ